MDSKLFDFLQYFSYILPQVVYFVSTSLLSPPPRCFAFRTGNGRTSLPIASLETIGFLDATGDGLSRRILYLALICFLVVGLKR